MLSVYIPFVLANTTQEFVSEVFEKNNIGIVSHVDMVFNGKKYSAYVHFSEWKSNYIANELENDKACRVYFDYPSGFEYKNGYWICLKNKSSKCTYLTPKVRIDVSGLQTKPEVEEEYEEEYDEEEYEEEEIESEEEEQNDNSWMDELLEKDADTESEAWDFMMEQLSREEDEKAMATASYVRNLEEEVAYLQHMLHKNAENAYYANNAWNHERSHLIKYSNVFRERSERVVPYE